VHARRCTPGDVFPCLGKPVSSMIESSIVWCAVIADRA
jgi:hypothetical protein